MARLIDLAGQRFERWLVIERAKNDKSGNVQWLCHCTCGEMKVVRGTALRDGYSKSCGCLSREAASKRRLIDLTGKRFGKWTVVKRAENSKLGAPRWLCYCDCGTKSIVEGSHLRSGHSKSCGCWRRYMASLPDGEATFNTLFIALRGRARRRGKEWSLTKEQVRVLTKQNCHYCGAKPHQVKRRKGLNGPYVYIGLDRVDSRRGYTIDNVVPCCWTCNKAKSAMSIKEFRLWVIRVCKHWAEK